MSDNLDELRTLVENFSTNIARFKKPETKEATLRYHFLNPFFKLLGWDVTNRNGLDVDVQEVIIEPSIEVAERDALRSRAPDYLFCIAGQKWFTCEAKKPSVNLDTDRDAIFQTKRDAYAIGLPFAILTDFEHFRLFDTGYKPDIHAPRHGLVADFSLQYSDYIAQWDVLLATFGRDAVAGGSLDRLRAKVRKTRASQRIRGIDRQLFELRGDVPAGKAFLAQLNLQRTHIAADLYRHNKTLFPDVQTARGCARLTEFTQRLIDRVVFMRICEDRKVVNYGSLRDLVDQANDNDHSLRDLLVREFRSYDRDFNGYLFKPHEVEKCDFTPSVLRDLIAEFYPPQSSANFVVLGDDLLATIYEQFLGSTIVVKGSKIEIEPKPEVRHAKGVYYTPKFVVDSILRRVVAPRLNGKKPLDLLDHELTILDPACGSGSFLIAAFDLLVSHCERAIRDDPKLATEKLPGSRKKQPIAYQQSRILDTDEFGVAKKIDKVWKLTPDFKGRLLTSCVFGIDIDAQAVEVSIMSLYIKMLADLPQDWRTINEQRLLPPLDNNIRCGNSLVDQDRLDQYANHLHGGLFTGDENVRFKLNAFDWHSSTRGFGRILGEPMETGKGFDCIIGNPPYIRVQELTKWNPEACQFYKWQYASAAKGNYDIYVVFTERCLTGGKQARGLLKPDGLMGFIMPHKWWQAAYGAGLRKIIAEGKLLRSVIDFGDQQVFHGATTYTAIQVFGGKATDTLVDVSRIEVLKDGASMLSMLDDNRNFANSIRFSWPVPDSQGWNINPPNEQFCFAGTVPLSQIARLAQGLKTSGDKIYIGSIVAIDARTVYFESRATGKRHIVERNVLRTLVKSEHMRAYLPEPSILALLFPYSINGETFEFMDEATLQSKAPHAWKYLTEVCEQLQDRESGRMRTRKDWYGYIYPKNFVALSRPKLMIPDMCEYLHVALDEPGNLIFSGGAAGGNAIIPHEAKQLHFLNGLLNSELMHRVKLTTGTRFRGGWLNCEVRFIRDLPIKLPVTVAEKKLAERIEASVRQIMTAKRALQASAGLGDRDREEYERTVESAQKRINADVLTLYDVHELPA